MFGIDLGVIGSALAFMGTAVGIGLLTGFVMLAVLKVLQEKYHLLV